MESVQIQMEKLLDEYCEEVKKVTEASAKSTAQDTCNLLKQTSPVNGSGSRAGRYARGWRVKSQDGGYIVHNATDYQLTHLLENGHDIYNRFGGSFGRSRANPHISNAEAFGIREFPIRISRGLR